MHGRRWTDTSKVQPKSRLGELTRSCLGWDEITHENDQLQMKRK